MKAQAIFSRLTDPDAGEILQHLYDEDKPAYRACLQVLAQRRRLRPVFLEKKARPERHGWMRKELARDSNADASAEVIQAWLLGAHRPMICAFLDALEIPHDGEGLLENLPAEPSQEKLQSAIDGLFEKYPSLPVSVYLLLFPEMDIGDWPTLDTMLNQDSRLHPESTTETPS